MPVRRCPAAANVPGLGQCARDVSTMEHLPGYHKRRLWDPTHPHLPYHPVTLTGLTRKLGKNSFGSPEQACLHWEDLLKSLLMGRSMLVSESGGTPPGREGSLEELLQAGRGLPQSRVL